jgi:hypothetical protein
VISSSWTLVKKIEVLIGCPTRLSCDLLLGMLSHILGITKEIMARGPQVLGMESRESNDLGMGPEGPYFLQCNPSISNSSIHHTSLVLK